MWPWIGPVPTYGILYFAGIILHFLVSWRIAKRYGLKRRVWITASVCYLIGMVLGAKLLYDLRHGPLDVTALFQAEHYMRGGLWGGLLAYWAMAVPTVLLLAQDKRAALDLIGLSIPVPWIAAKLGCLLNGCCYGKPCSLPWAITFPEVARGAPAGVPLHPTQLYESAGEFINFLILIALRKNKSFNGQLFMTYLLLYSVLRFIVEFFRGDVNRGFIAPQLSVSQGISILMFLIAVAGLIVLRQRNSRA